MIDLRLEAEGPDGWAYLVRVAEGAGQTEHRVRLAEPDYQRLTAGKISPDVLLQWTFEFLLAREPKESILRQFDLAVVSRYFPDFESVIRWRFKSSVCRAANTNGW
jgi:hypothetical protein